MKNSLAIIEVPNLRGEESVAVKDIVAMRPERAPVDRDSGGGKEAFEVVRHSPSGEKGSD